MQEGCHVDVIDKSPSTEERRQQTEALMVVEGMGCPNCVNRVRNGLLLVYGVLSADVTLGTRQARVLYNATLVRPEQLVHAVASAGGDGRHHYRARLVV